MRFKKTPDESLLFAISPARCFETLFTLKPLQGKITTARYRLKDELGMEEGDGIVYGSIDDKGLVFHIAADLSHEGDGVEIFLDSRPGLSAIIGRFCHRFVFDGTLREETPFRTPEESHPLCDPKLLKWEGDAKGVTLYLPKEAICGFRCGVFGFALRLRAQGHIQHLGVSVREGSFENHPVQWAQLMVDSVGDKSSSHTSGS